MLRLALRNIRRQWLRTALTLAAIVFGVVGLVLSGGFVEDIFVQLRETLIHSQSGHLQIYRKGYFEQGTRSPEKYRIDEAGLLVDPLASLPEVDEVLTRLSFSGLLNNGRSDMPIVGEGVEPDKEARLGRSVSIVAGRQLTQEDSFGLLLGYGVAQALKLQPGDRATVLLNTADGALNSLDFEVVGVFQSFSKDYDARAVRIPLAAAKELLNTEGVNSVVVSLKRTEDTQRVVQKVARMLDASQYEIKDWRELNDFYGKTVELYQSQFGALQLIILLMVLLSVINTINMSVFERVGEFGTMMAIGNRRGEVFRLVLLENFVLGAIGATIGVVLGWLLALAISAVGIPMPPPPNANIGYTAQILVLPSVAITAFVVGFFATTLAAILPASRVARIPVCDALRQNYH